MSLLPTIADLEGGKQNLDFIHEVANGDQNSSHTSPDGKTVDSVAKAIQSLKSVTFVNEAGSYAYENERLYNIKEAIIDGGIAYMRVIAGTSPASPATFADEYNGGDGPWVILQGVTRAEMQSTQPGFGSELVGKLTADTQAEMTAWPKPNGPIRVHTNRRGIENNIFDGSYGDWVWDSNSTATPDGGTVLAHDSGGSGRFLREFGGAVSVKWFGAIGDGSSDDTTACQNAINTGRSVFWPGPSTYVVGGLSVNNKSDVEYYAHKDVVLTKVGATSKNTFIFDMVGSLFSITYRGLTLTGDGTTDAHNSGIACASGQIGAKLKVIDCNFSDVRVGVSFNADLSGSFNDCSIESCCFTDIVGEVPGTGYAVHLPNAYGTNVHACVFDNVGRHSIYVPKGGNVRISNCLIKNHRRDTAVNAFRPAVLFAGVNSGCSIKNSVFLDFYDGGVGVVSATSASDNIRNTVIEGCHFINPMNSAASSVFIGEQLLPSGGAYVDGVIVNGCTFYADQSIASPPGVLALNGRHINVSNCSFYYDNVTSSFSGVVFGSNSYSPNVDDLSHVSIHDCEYVVNGSSGTFYAVALEGYLGSDVDRRVYVDNRQFEISSGISLQPCASLSYGFANTAVQGNGRAGALGCFHGVAAPTTGTWKRGDRMWNLIPSAEGNMGWVCVVAGTPGTWKPFGTISA